MYGKPKDDGSDVDMKDEDNEPAKKVVAKMDLSALLSGNKPQENTTNNAGVAKAPVAAPLSLAERMALMRKKVDDAPPDAEKKKEKKPRDPNKVKKKLSFTE